MTEWAWNDSTDGQAESRAWKANTSRPPMMLRLVFENGSWRSLPYTDLAAVEFLGELVKLYYPYATAAIKGPALRELAELLDGHYVECIQERHASPFEVDPHAGYVERIELGQPNLEWLACRPIG